MVGHPKFKRGDIVSFKLGNQILTGKVEIIDKYGTFMDDSEVYYDVWCDVNGIHSLIKHIKETGLSEVKDA